MRSLKTLFDEFASVMQFPSYFGQNWDAFDECINDLEWLAGSAYILIITKANQLLIEEEKKQLSIFLHTLQDASTEWSQKTEPDSPTPFHVLLLADQKYLDTIKNSLHAEGIEWNLFKG